MTSTGFETLVMGRVVAGLSTGLLTTLVQVMAAKSDEVKQSFVLMNLSVLAGGAALVASSAPLLATYGPVGILGLNALLAALVLLVMTRAPSVPLPASPRSDLTPLNVSGAIAALTVLFLFSIAMNGIFIFSVALGTQAGLAVADVSKVMLIGLGMSFAGGLLVSKVSARVVLPLATALLCAAAIALGYAASFTTFTLALGGLMFASGLVVPVLYLLTVEVDPNGSVAAVGPVAMMLGGASGSVLIGAALKSQAFSRFSIPYALVLTVGVGAFEIFQRRLATAPDNG